MISFATEMALMVLEPMYQTFKELKTNDAQRTAAAAASQQRSRELLVHWMVYGAFRVVCLVAEPLPMYNVMKIGAIVWLRSGGTETVRRLMQRFLAEHEPTVDRWLERFNRAVETFPNRSFEASIFVSRDNTALPQQPDGQEAEAAPRTT